jgi:hypothetical protein
VLASSVPRFGSSVELQIDFKAAKGKYKWKWPGVARSIRPVEKDKRSHASLFIELERRFPWAGVPAVILCRHYLERLAPIGKLA